MNDGTTRSFTTFAAPNATAAFSFAVTADLKNISAFPSIPAPAYASIAAQNHAFFMQLGDFDHRNVTTLATMRDMHRDVRSPGSAAGADFAEFIAPNLPMVHIWDDHDFGGNNSDKNFSGKAAALQAYNEYYPTVNRPNPAGIWHSFRYGVAEFFMLDVRSQRDPATQSDGPSKSMLDGNQIANDQLDWLKDGLLSSTAAWKFIASGVAFNPTTKPKDSWGAYARERRELVDFINSNAVKGVIFLTGDLHSGGAIDDGTHSDFPEMSVPHTNMNSSSFSTGPPGTWSEGIDTGAVSGGYATVTVSGNQVILQTRTASGSIKKSLTVSLPPAAGGPTTSDVSVTPDNATAGPLAINALVDDVNTGGSSIVAAEYFIDSVGGQGTGSPMAAVDGQFNSPTELVGGTIDQSSFAALSAGLHTVFVRGQDAMGRWGVVTSDTFVKQLEPTNQPPTVSAGADRAITLPNNSVNLDGTVTDDNFPSFPLTTTWTRFSGPGTVTFGNASSIDTTATFSQAGTYVLRLTANDGQFNVSDDVQIIVNPQPPAGPAVTSFTLIDADTDLPLGLLTHGQTINLANLPTQHLNVRANTSGTIGSVRFGLDAQANFRTENTSPYALFGDNNGNYSNGSFALGSHTLTGTPFSGANGSGAAGTALSITFTVINQSTPLNQPPTVSAGAEQALSAARFDILSMAALHTRSSKPATSALQPSRTLDIRDKAFAQQLDLSHGHTAQVAVETPGEPLAENHTGPVADLSKFTAANDTWELAIESLDCTYPVCRHCTGLA